MADNLLLHLGGPQSCAGEHIQGAYFACPLYRSGRSLNWLKFKNRKHGRRRGSGEEWGGDKTLRELCRFREESEMPERVQLRRTKGWRMPRNTVKVDRTTMWGNHIAATCCIKDRAAAVELFRRWVDEGASLAWKGRAATDLRGKNLACWCPLDQPCHADVLLEMANQSPQLAAQILKSRNPQQCGEAERLEDRGRYRRRI